MPIHHKAVEKRKVTRKKKPTNEGRTLIRSRTFLNLKRGDSKPEIIVPEVGPSTPPYLKDVFDYDKSSSSEENVSDDGMCRMRHFILGVPVIYEQINRRRLQSHFSHFSEKQHQNQHVKHRLKKKNFV